MQKFNYSNDDASDDDATTVTAARVWNMLPPAITSLPSLQTFKRAVKSCFADRTAKHTSGNSSIDTSLIRDIYCGPEVLFETCVAMKFVDDDDNDDTHDDDDEVD